MKKQRKTKQVAVQKKEFPPVLSKRLREGGLILLSTLAVAVFFALYTYNPIDPGLFNVNQAASNANNALGILGAYTADLLYHGLGYAAYLLPFGFLLASWYCFHEPQAAGKMSRAAWAIRGLGFTLLLLGFSGILAMDAQGAASLDLPGGQLGQSLAESFTAVLNEQGALMLFFAELMVGLTWCTGLSWLLTAELLGRLTLQVLRFTATGLQKLTRMTALSLPKLKLPSLPKFSFSSRNNQFPRDKAPNKGTVLLKKEKLQNRLTAAIDRKEAPAKIEVEKTLPKYQGSSSLPPLNLLNKGKPGKPMGGYSHAELEQLSREVEQHLLDFGIQVEVVAVHPGPVITRFELQLAAGVKASKLTALSTDLARSLCVSSVRVVEIIPGKTVVGIELPNPNRATVCLSEVFTADVYQKAHSPLSMALGVDIAGHPMVVDLAKMPHLLVAGTTGSGKSVGINAMILSLLFKASPEQVRLIMVDPKMLELSVYDGIPHLLTPVVTDMKEAASSLRWAVAEMERRYRLMAALGVRNIVGYNSKVEEALAENKPIADPLWKANESTLEKAPSLETMSYIVIVIDELADMMMVVGKKVEQLIARIAQKARAAGIHLILATQRPSVDVLTGLIKSNIPTRISFQVSSKIDSRTILDQQGAEQLLGNGDMLFLAPGTGAPLRVHGAFVDDKEVHLVAEELRSRGQPQYIEAITQQFDPTDGDSLGSNEGGATEDSDPLYDQAVEFVIQSRKASVSSVQRRFKIGYNRAARLVEEMERTGLVGPLDNGNREILVSSSEA